MRAAREHRRAEQMLLQSHLSGHSADVPRGSSQHDLDVLTFPMYTPRAHPWRHMSSPLRSLWEA